MSAKEDKDGRIDRRRPPPPPPTTTTTTSINELDDIVSAKKWMSKGRVDTKGFAKYLPHTSRDLRDGKVTIDQVIVNLEVEEICSADRNRDRNRWTLYNVALGSHYYKHICWECESFSEGGLQHCAKCKSASYCSRDCQISAWKQGHKLKCSALRSKYAAFEKSFKTVDDAYKIPIDSAAAAAVIECGIALSYKVDYAVLRHISLMPSPYEGVECGKILGEPQMEVFYKNIVRVDRGEFWFYDDAAYADYKEANLTQENENTFFELLCTFMCYDFFGISPSSTFPESSAVMRIKDRYGGVGMPASTFIRMYKLDGGAADSTNRRFRMRREVRNETIRSFVDTFLK